MIQRYDTVNADFELLNKNLNQKTSEYNLTRWELDRLKLENQQLQEQFGEVHRLQSENAKLMHENEEVDCLRRDESAKLIRKTQEVDDLRHENC